LRPSIGSSTLKRESICCQYASDQDTYPFLFHVQNQCPTRQLTNCEECDIFARAESLRSSSDLLCGVGRNESLEMIGEQTLQRQSERTFFVPCLARPGQCRIPPAQRYS
jgi:hypothetical protein